MLVIKDKEIELFELCDKLTSLLGDKEAIADVRKIASLHPEMFEKILDVIEVIREVLQEPEIIIHNTRPKNDKDFIVAKQLNVEKIGDVGIRNDNGTNVVFHANKKRLKNLEVLREKIKKGDLKSAITGEDAHTPHIPRPAGLGANVANANSVVAISIMPENSKQDSLDNEHSNGLEDKKNALTYFKENKPSNVLESTKDVISTDKLTGRKQRK